MNPARTLGAAFAFWDFSHFFVYLFATLGTYPGTNSLLSVFVFGL